MDHEEEHNDNRTAGIQNTGYSEPSFLDVASAQRLRGSEAGYGASDVFRSGEADDPALLGSRRAREGAGRRHVAFANRRRHRGAFAFGSAGGRRIPLRRGVGACRPRRREAHGGPPMALGPCDWWKPSSRSGRRRPEDLNCDAVRPGDVACLVPVFANVGPRSRPVVFLVALASHLTACGEASYSVALSLGLHLLLFPRRSDK
jgi:hypothetical protein